MAERDRPKDDWARHPADVARLCLALVALLLALVVAALYPEAVKGASADLVQLVLRLPRILRVAIIGLTQMVAVSAPVVLAGWLLRQGRIRLLALIAASATVAALALVTLQDWLDRTVPPYVLGRLDARSWVTGSAFPSGAYLAASAAVAVVLGSTLTSSWKRVLWSAVAVTAACRFVTAVAVPLNIAVTLTVGVVAGSAALAVFGAPRRRYSLVEIRTGVARAGVTVGELVPVDGAGFGDADLRLTTDAAVVGADEPGPAQVLFIGRDSRDAELLFRVLRWIRTKGIEARPLGWRPTTRVQHEAFATMLASSVVTTVGVLGVGETPSGEAVLVLSEPVGTPLVDIDPGRLDDKTLAAIWETVAALRGRRLAHRSLHGRNLLVDDHGLVGVVGFAVAVPGATDAELNADLAEVLVTMAALVGTARVIATVQESPLPVEALEASLSLLQPLALSSVTREMLRSDKALVDELRSALAEALGVEKVELTDLARLSVAKVMSTVGMVFLLGIGLSFAANLEEIGAALSHANWSYIPFIVATVVFGYFAATWSLLGAVSAPLPFLRTAQVSLAQTFLNRFTPANAGGMALRARYLQKNGLELSVAATSIGLTSAASGAMQVLLLAVLFAWNGSSGSFGFTMPDASTIAIGVFAVSIVVGILYLSPWGKSLVFARVRSFVTDAFGELAVVASRPSKLLALFGGALVGKLTTILAFNASCQALGVSLTFPRMALLYMTANTIAAAAPTPGGIGAIEAALVAALTGAGVEPAEALSIVVVFRLMTFWLPVPPSWLALHHLRTIDAV